MGILSQNRSVDPDTVRANRPVTYGLGHKYAAISSTYYCPPEMMKRMTVALHNVEKRIKKKQVKIRRIK